MAKKRARKADGGAMDGTEEPEQQQLIVIPEDPADAANDNGVTVDPLSGAVVIEHEDGSITIDPDGDSLRTAPLGDPDFGDNLADHIDPMELGRLADQQVELIESDKTDRQQWLSMRARVIELLGLKLEDPKGDVSRSALGMATASVRDPTMLQAINMFRANTYGELCPSSGPVKVKIASPKEALTSQENANNLQADLNAYLMNTASEYYPDMFYMLWWTGLASGTFKKVYTCPLRRRPVSEYIDGTRLIVTDSTDLKNAERVTQEVTMPKSIMRAMQLRKVYRDIKLQEPMDTPRNAVEDKRASLSGMGNKPQNIEDQQYQLYECYCKLDIKGFEHKIDGEPSGLPLPYKITIEANSKQVLEVRRNWEEPDEGEDEDDIYYEPMIPFVAFPFSTGLLRTYGTGLGHEMGNMASALTALLRISIDAGILGNYPGAMKAKGTGRDVVNEIMVPPGGVVEIDTGGMPIQQVMMPLPYKDASPAVMQLIEQNRGAAKELGGTANIPLAGGESSAAIPVGTMLAQIEQALKPLAAVHKMLCSAQADEFRKLVRLFKDDPAAIWRGNKRPKCGANMAERLAVWKQALEDCDIEPVADPNVPSEMHRKLMAMALKQLTAGNPAYDQVKIDRWIALMVFKMSTEEFDQFLAPQGAAPPDPAMMALQIEAHKAETARMKAQGDLQLKDKDISQRSRIDEAKLALSASEGGEAPAAPNPNEARALDIKQMQVEDNRKKMMLDFHGKNMDREAKVTAQALDLAANIAVHPESDGIVDQQLAELAPYLAPLGGSANNPARGSGGPVKTEGEHQSDHHAQGLANEILKALMERRQAGIPTH